MQSGPSESLHDPDLDFEFVLVKHVPEAPQGIHPGSLARRIAHPDQQIDSTLVNHALCVVNPSRQSRLPFRWEVGRAYNLHRRELGNLHKETGYQFQFPQRTRLLAN